MADSEAQERASEDVAPNPADRAQLALRDQVRTRQLARLGALFAGFAHEIRNPLSTIGLNLQLVQEDLGEPKDPRDQRIKRRLTVVESEVRRLQEILEGFLGFVRIPDLKLQRIHVREWLAEVVEFLRPAAEERQISLRFYADGLVDHVQLDTSQMRAVIVNLIQNAMDACEAGDEVLLGLRRIEPSQVAISVMDTGAGIDADIVEQVFTPYFSTKKHGTGLGLPTARRIVEQHGGSIELASEPGQGSQFTIVLPETLAADDPGGDGDDS